MKKHITELIAVFVIVGILLMEIRMPIGTAASQTDINNAIEKGLAYLNSTQNPSGSWGASSGYPVACTAMAVLAFENAPNSHYGWNLTDPYHTTVQKGLDWLFAQAGVQTLTNQTAGNPDTNGNGIGIYFSTSDTVYQTPMVLMAIVASINQSGVATTGPANVKGRTYHDITVDIVDWLAWAQDEAGNGRGGWRYEPNLADSDNSNTQWPALGLMTAELWGINAPAFVKSELLNYWIPYTQNLAGNYSTNYFYGAFGYGDSSWGPTGLETIAETSAGILELTYCGVNKTDPRITAAQGYIARDWLTNSGWRCNIGNFYAMYAVMKACRLATPQPIQFIANYTGNASVEWYNGTGEYADALVTNQSSDGHWAQWVAPEAVATDLSTAWGALILEFRFIPVTYSLTVKVVDVRNNAPIANVAVDVEGEGSYPGTTNSNGQVVFPAVLAGSNVINASKTGYMPGSVTITLVKDTTVTIALTPVLTPQIHKACMEICPEILNLNGNCGRITCFIWLPQGYKARDVNVSSILLNNTIHAEPRPVCLLGNWVMVEFDRADVDALILSHGVKCGRVTLTVDFRLKDGTKFEGSDSIRVTTSRHSWWDNDWS